MTYKKMELIIKKIMMTRMKLQKNRLENLSKIFLLAEYF